VIKKISIIASIIIVIGIGVFSFSQSEIIEKQTASESVKDGQISGLLKKVEEDRIAAEKAGFEMHKPREWLTAGPFQIDRSEYHLGEKIFINVAPLPSDFNGEMVFAKIVNSTHAKIYKKLAFMGSQEEQNRYFTAFPSMPRNFCTVDDIVGDWELTFTGINLNPLEFKILDTYIPGTIDYFDPVC
jgi:hypothetical protein